jgi:exosome complex component RRP46
VLEAADGSAKWVQEGSAVLSAVHGPVAAGPRREDAERAVIEVLMKPRSGLPGAHVSGARVLVMGALRPAHPRTTHAAPCAHHARAAVTRRPC